MCRAAEWRTLMIGTRTTATLRPALGESVMQGRRRSAPGHSEFPSDSHANGLSVQVDAHKGGLS